MRSTLYRMSVILAGVAMVTACTAEQPGGGDPPPSTTESPSEPADEPTEPEPSGPDIDSIADATWSFGDVGYADAPIDVDLVSGHAEITFSEWEGVLEMGEPMLMDLDGDGDEDVLVPISFLADVNDEAQELVLTEWYAWASTDDGLEQVIYPIASSGECADGEPVINAVESGGVEIEQLRMGEESACAEGPTIEVTRVVELAYGDGGEIWPMQTEPLLAWGGTCPRLAGPSDGEVDLVVAPGVQAPVSPEAPPVAVGMHESWLDSAVPGWGVVGFVTADQQLEEYSCGWTATDSPN